ncbi:MAG: hypothetical protein CMM74_14105 [Rhodospirillaceae bacterium]|nr:hypothetical protein [Rhodospirillaceae bacterium]
MTEITERVEPLLSCSLTGIVRATVGVKGAVPLVHGPMSCASGHRPIPLQAGQEPLVPTTTLTDIDMVRGTGDKLEESTRKLHDVYQPRLIVVILTCATSLISEFHRARLQAISEELGCLILCVDGSAMAGDEVEGYRLFVQALETALADRSQAGDVPTGTICLRGLSPTDYGMSHERGTLADLLQQGLDCRVEGTLLWEFDLDCDAHWLRSPSVPVGWLWTEAAAGWTPAPYGVAGTRRWLVGCGRALRREFDPQTISDLSGDAAELAAMRRSGELSQVRVAVEGLSWWAVGLGRFLKEELGCAVLLSTDQPALEYQRQHGPIADMTLIDVGNFELLTYLDEFQPQVVFGSSYMRSGPWHWVPFYQPVWHPIDETLGFMGPQGALRIARLLGEIREMYA